MAAYQGKYNPTSYKNPLAGGAGVLGGDLIAQGQDLIDEDRKLAREERIRANSRADLAEKRAYEEGVLSEEREYKEGKETEAKERLLDDTTPEGMEFKSKLAEREAKTVKAKAEADYYQKGKGKGKGSLEEGKHSDDLKYELKRIDGKEKELKDLRLNLDPEKDAEQLADINNSLAILDKKRALARMTPEKREAELARLRKMKEQRLKETADGAGDVEVATDKPTTTSSKIGSGNIEGKEKARLMNKYFSNSPVAVSQKMLKEAQQAERIELMMEQNKGQRLSPGVMEAGSIQFPGRL